MQDKNVYEKLAFWVSDTVARTDNFVNTAKGCAGLTRSEGHWTRENALASSLSGMYDEKTIHAVLVLLQPTLTREYTSRRYGNEF